MLVSALYVMCVVVVTNSAVGPHRGRTWEVDSMKAPGVSSTAILVELNTITDLLLRTNQQFAEVATKPINPVVHDCSTLYDAGIKASGVYSLFPFTFRVYCDMQTDGGGWTVIQRRYPKDFHEDFNQPWAAYKTGFGLLEEEFWLGLEPLHQLTSSGDYELRVDMVDYELGSRYAKYKTINVGNETDGYQLLVSGYQGDAGDALTRFHSGRKFSTFDRDQDVSRNKSCAREKEGGWWFHACYAAHPNGRYPANPSRKQNGTEMRWWSTHKDVLVLTNIGLKIRKRRYAATYHTDSPNANVTETSKEPLITSTDSTLFDYDLNSSTNETLSTIYPGTTESEDNVTDHIEKSPIFPWYSDVHIEVLDEEESNKNKSSGRSDISPWDIWNKRRKPQS
ncbi:unnamed protein product [Meganyctiphanes norvegica]|uniref:Fibrinogen C-terminal domain-containing protein n=1 Tax=Meganyctiphanes norvegica TaxID=48144 RepID=A0AAV2QEY9_MEGNR